MNRNHAIRLHLENGDNVREIARKGLCTQGVASGVKYATPRHLALNVRQVAHDAAPLAVPTAAERAFLHQVLRGEVHADDLRTAAFCNLAGWVTRARPGVYVKNPTTLKALSR